MMLALILQGALLLGGQAPDQNAEVEKLFAEGASLYKAGKYRPAIDKFETAYALFPEPNLLYNIARAHEALGEIDQAILKYNLCSLNPRATEDLKQKAAGKVAVLTAARAQGAAAPSGTGTTTTTTTTTPATGTGTTGTTTTTPVPAPSTAVASGPPILGIAGGVTAGLGVVGAVAGGVFYAIGAGTHGELETALAAGDGGVVALTRAEAEAQSAAGTTDKTTGVVLLGVGGALVVGGGALLTMQLLGGE